MAREHAHLRSRLISIRSALKRATKLVNLAFMRLYTLVGQAQKNSTEVDQIGFQRLELLCSKKSAKCQTVALTIGTGM